MTATLFPAFLKLTGRRVVVVGAGPVGASKIDSLLAAGADVTVVAPEVVPAVETAPVRIERRRFEPDDLDGAWFVVAAAPPDVNRAVRAAADARQLFVNAVDDPPNATAYLGGIVRKHGVTLAISTDGRAPALAGLLREGLETLLPDDIEAWLEVSRRERENWKRGDVPMERAPAVAARGDQSTLRGAGGVGVSARVALVGAGPGDPGLLTRRALYLLRRADLVLYDALVPMAIVDVARRARRFYVGKRAGRHAMTQESIHRLLIRAAPRGQRVVRLKGGDPFVFGRGGEEALALKAAGIQVEVVPGVSSALAAPALAGIPVTHRGHLDRRRGRLRPRRGRLRAAPRQRRAECRHHRRADGACDTRRDCRAAAGGGLVAGDTGGDRLRRGAGCRACVVGTSGDAGRRAGSREPPGNAGHRPGGRACAAHRRRRWRCRQPPKPTSSNDRDEGNHMSSINDATTFGRARLSFANESEVDEFASTLDKFERGEITADQWRAFRLVRGTYGQRQTDDASMLRIKIPQGILTRRADPRDRRRRRHLLARLRPHHDAAEHPAPFHPPARRRAGDAPARGGRPDDARSVRQLGAEHHRLPVSAASPRTRRSTSRRTRKR